VLRPPGYASLLRYLPRLPTWLSAHQRSKQVLKALWAVDQLEPDERIHCHFAGEAAEWALLARRLRGTPYAVTVHAADLFKPRPSLAEVLDGADAVLTVSRHNREVIQQRYAVEARVVHCGVRASDWPRVTGGEHVLCVARDVPKKGLDVLVDAAERAGVSLLLAGPGTERLGGLGAVDKATIRQLQARSRVFALACLEAPDGDRDGLPVAMMEAMCAGLPVVTTTLPGLEELVTDEVGWRVPPGDAGALAEALRGACADDEKGPRAREHVLAHFSLEAQVQGVLAAHA
jgi:glycosyltransferase involved in cell wall biosynthesis